MQTNEELVKTMLEDAEQVDLLSAALFCMSDGAKAKLKNRWVAILDNAALNTGS